MNLDVFNEYREIDLEIIKLIKEDKEDETLFEKREEVIEKILSLSLEKSEIKKLYIEKKLDILDKELECVLKEKMSSVKSEIKEIANKKQANLGYATANRGNNFFSKRV
ncbi:flagellar protein FliT [Clostridium botulinum]|uniref:flagellar protein FliT n=1 Tax=Clostridium botulinum TaxID=1491 RepID=UPI0013CB9F10|nr:flagellar protein FliT [Clostridium botulinum]MBN1057654.1 flagellar protein FliT [Clostridium botulinum]MBN1060899.1 flagellar protein FliT [Clostridium botulinum]NFO11820.1 flagellar protein FliT [Clostridium botulinum]NFO32335.1 flagellar protein FliT [Clostridium botulinum]